MLLKFNRKNNVKNRDKNVGGINFKKHIMKKEFFDSLSLFFFLSIFAVVAFLHCFHIENRAGETYNEKVEIKHAAAARCDVL